MNKIEAICAVFAQNSLHLSEVSAEALLHVAKEVFVKPSAYTVALLDKKLLEVSGDKVTTSFLGDSILCDAAEMHMDYLKSNGMAPKEITTKKARGVSDEMTALMEHFKALVIEKGFDFKDIQIDRSNYYVNINKRQHYVRRFEVRRDGTVRVFTYGLPTELLKNYAAAGATYREAGKNCYIDFDASIENINKLVEITVKH